MDEFIWDISFYEQRSQLSLKVIGGKRNFVYMYMGVPYAIYDKLSILYKKSIDEDQKVLHGTIRKILRPYKFEKKDMK